MKKFILIIFLFLSTTIATYSEENILLPSELGKIINIEYIDENNEVVQTKQEVEVVLLGGQFKGKTIILDNMLTNNPYYDLRLKNGMIVVLHVENSENGLTYSIQDIYRSNILLYLTALFCGLLIYIGRKKGLYSLISILITCIFIIKILSPLILAGINPILATIIICLLSTATTMYLVGGFNRKSTASTLGCTLSLIIAGILSLLVVKYASLSGFSNENSMFLYSAHPELNFIAITVSTMIIATMGAVMDVSMSIASTINEIHLIDCNKTTRELFKSGMNVGKDIIGTMANTLILVYLVASLPLVLLVSNIDLQKFMNLNQVVTEISSALIGSSAIIICVPLTAIISAILIKKERFAEFSFDKKE